LIKKPPGIYRVYHANYISITISKGFQIYHANLKMMCNLTHQKTTTVKRNLR
jgi:hypothetical protein